MATPVSFTCTFTEPILYNGSTPANTGQNWQFKNEICTYSGSVYAPGTTTATSTDIQMYASFTAGEVFMAMLMFVLIVIELGKMLARALDRVKTKKKFLSYSGGDVEVRQDL